MAPCTRIGPGPPRSVINQEKGPQAGLQQNPTEACSQMSSSSQMISTCVKLTKNKINNNKKNLPRTMDKALQDWKLVVTGKQSGLVSEICVHGC